jgi:hypothetical protein
METRTSNAALREYLDAIHEKELKDVLIKLELLDAIENGEMNCFICEKTVRLNNIGIIFVQDGEFKFLCDSKNCYWEFMRRRGSQE